MTEPITHSVETIADTGMTLFTEGDTLYESMLAAIVTAKTMIRCASYIFSSDDIGWQFARAFAERARQGVLVRLQVDAHGSSSCLTRQMKIFLKNNGVRLHIFHRWNWRRPFQYTLRDHRKLLIIDNQVAYLGGFNIDARNSYRLSGKERWRDTHMSLAGPLVIHAIRCFDHIWNKKHSELRLEEPFEKTQLVSKHTLRAERGMREFFTQAWKDSKKFIDLTTPYFVPDRYTQNQLIMAAKRGVDVRVLLPAKTDVRLCRWAARAAYAKLLHAGIKIYEYQPRILHAKTMTIDGTWASVGTANMDTLSLLFNYELNLVSKEPVLSERLQAHFFRDLQESVEITKSTWPNRPWSDRIAELIGWLARHFL